MDNRESLALAEKVQKILRREPAIVGYYKGEKCLKENLKKCFKINEAIEIAVLKHFSATKVRWAQVVSE